MSGVTETEGASFMGRVRAVLRSRLAWRLGLGLFLAILVIELIILVPSAWRFVDERLGIDRELAVALVTQAARDLPADLRDIDVPGALGARLVGGPLDGGAVHLPGGRRLGVFGTPPTLGVADFTSRGVDLARVNAGARHEFLVAVSSPAGPLTVVVGKDGSWLAGEIWAYVGRIMGLVAIISISVCVTMTAIVATVVLAPLLSIRRSLLDAASDPRRPRRYLLAEGRRDELGDVARAVNRLLTDGARDFLVEIDGLRRLSDAALEGLFVYGANGALVAWNRAARDLVRFESPRDCEVAGLPLITGEGGQGMPRPLSEVSQGLAPGAGPYAASMIVRGGTAIRVSLARAADPEGAPGEAGPLRIARVAPLPDGHSLPDLPEDKPSERAGDATEGEILLKP